MNANTAIATFRATFRWKVRTNHRSYRTRAVAATMCAAMHYLMKMAANASDADSDAILAFYLFTRRRRRKRIYRGMYVHPILQKRHIYGKYHQLGKELHFHPYKFHRVKPGPSSTKTKELMDSQEIVRATMA